MRRSFNAFMEKRNLSELVHAPGELALQIARLVPMDHTTLGELIDHCYHRRRLLTGSGLVVHFLEVADSVTGSFTIIAVTLTTLGGLTHIFLSCLVICHVLLISEGKGKE